MNHKPIQFKDLSLSYPHKTCFEAFSGQVHFGERIAIIGLNGAGKSTLLKILYGVSKPSEGEIVLPHDVTPGYLPQIIGDFPILSGGQRLNQLLTTILAKNPNVLLLDEPTNHLDSRNRRSLIRMLQHYSGTLLIVTHDTELIQATTNLLWHIEGRRVLVFSGRLIDYQQMLSQKKATIEQELTSLSRQKKAAHLTLMKEQNRIAKSRASGKKKVKNRKWLKMVGDLKGMKAEKSQGKKLQAIESKKEELSAELANLRLPEVIQPTFKLNSALYHKALISIRNAAVSYGTAPPVLIDINFHMRAQERVALCGDNGSGKSTLVKAILAEPSLITRGDWLVPKPCDIGYLDQHYQQLAQDKTVLDLMLNALPNASLIEVRTHLNNFLFRKNEEVQMRVKDLSGGEKARLSLALIAAHPPKLLILDELTNNLDWETRAHVISVVREFPGALLVISHDEDFLTAIRIETKYHLHQAKIHRCHETLTEVTYYE